MRRARERAALSSPACPKCANETLSLIKYLKQKTSPYENY